MRQRPLSRDRLTVWYTVEFLDIEEWVIAPYSHVINERLALDEARERLSVLRMNHPLEIFRLVKVTMTHEVIDVYE